LKKYVPDDRTNAFLQIAGGAYDFSSDTKTITNLTVAGNPIDNQKEYTVLIPSFLAEGGDGFPVKAVLKTYDLTIRDMIISAMKQSQKPIQSFENRIKKVK
ncbi:MAG: 5'-nucleotidase C-terminal domain-containing protein, partial [Alphaproteobacteria bacterium]|nr:5'-nucleotidase C-terminal domain-containing protein [Alphaproteobacteria bacterium]